MSTIPFGTSKKRNSWLVGINKNKNLLKDPFRHSSLQNCELGIDAANEESESSLTTFFFPFPLGKKKKVNLEVAEAFNLNLICLW